MSFDVQHSGDQGAIEIVEQVAEQHDTSPEDLPPLYETIDSDALDALFDSTSESMRVTFTYCGYQIEITGNKQRRMINVQSNARESHQH
ncbi:HalOD1 output domain-containing protein [Halovivax sp.]|uniref:HalOD1 output domain-containing protein n=1 Tax=Halovivax sp. TaxID=1935978 RepID=UPI0025B9D15F|nr:HalOD1 output domain-containing protein [Halovivax sp.]